MNLAAGINGDNGMPAAPKGKRGMLILGVLVIAALVGGGIWWYSLRLAITTDNAKVTGDIVDISARTSGLLMQILVPEGEEVKTGQVLARLDDNQAKINLLQAEAALEIARANTSKLPADLTSAQAAVTKAKEAAISNEAQAKSAAITAEDAGRQLSKMQTLFNQGALAQESLDQARTRYETALANAEALKAAAASAQAAVTDAQAKMDTLGQTGSASYNAQYKQAQAVFENAQLALDNTVIKAQIDGTVVRIPVQAGENINDGHSLITVANLKQVWVTANIQEKQVGRVKKGQLVDVRIDAYPGQVFSGRVKEIGEATQSTFALIPTENTAGNFTKVSQRIPIKIGVEARGFIFKPGMSSVVKIHTR
ncbi:MAG: HlyD family secretion protein [Methylocystaceae bacterium]